MMRLFLLLSLLFVGVFITPSAALAQIMDPNGPDLSFNTGNTLYKITSLGTLITRVLQIGLGIVGLLVLVYIIWGGVDWILAGGDKGKVEAARSKITQGVIGLAVFASVFAIYFILARFLGLGNRLNILGGGGSGGANPGGGGTQQGVCAGNVAVGATVNDGGSGNYCTGNGAAMVKCVGPGVGPSGFSWAHYEPCNCLSGTPSYSWPANCPY